MLAKIYKAILLIALLTGINGCKNADRADNVVQNKLLLNIHQDVYDEEVNHMFTFSIVNPILIKSLEIIVDGTVWESELNGYRIIEPLEFDSIEMVESIRFNLSHDTIKAIEYPDSDDFREKGVYGITDWDAYRKAQSMYSEKVDKERVNVMNRFVSSLKDQSKIVIKAKGRLRNAEYEITKENLEAIISLWQLYDEF